MSSAASTDFERVSPQDRPASQEEPGHGPVGADTPRAVERSGPLGSQGHTSSEERPAVVPAPGSSAATVEWVVIDRTTNNQLGEFGTLADAEAFVKEIRPLGRFGPAGHDLQILKATKPHEGRMTEREGARLLTGGSSDEGDAGSIPAPSVPTAASTEPPRYDEALSKHGGRDSLSDYERGYVDALYAYAINSIEGLIVGSGIHTLGQAVDIFLTNERRLSE